MDFAILRGGRSIFFPRVTQEKINQGLQDPFILQSANMSRIDTSETVTYALMQRRGLWDPETISVSTLVGGILGDKPCD